MNLLDRFPVTCPGCGAQGMAGLSLLMLMGGNDGHVSRQKCS